MATPPLNAPAGCPFHTLPAEILLEIISSVPFTPANFLSLRLTCRRFHDVLSQHERPIAINTRSRTFSPSTSALFPGVEKDSLINLSRLSTRINTLEIVHEQWLQITSNSPELEWLKGRFEGIHKAGLLLLYHLHDLSHHSRQQRGQNNPPICDHCRKIAFLGSLPATSLACLLFKLIATVKILRIYGPEPIKETYARGDVGVRSDVELACEEVLLRKGPEFFMALMQTSRNPKRMARAVGQLEEELCALPNRQSAGHPSTLIATLRSALATAAGVEVRFAVSKMWEILASTGFDRLNDEGEGKSSERLVKVVRGQELEKEEKGMRRIF